MRDIPLRTRLAARQVHMVQVARLPPLDRRNERIEDIVPAMVILK